VEGSTSRAAKCRLYNSHTLPHVRFTPDRLSLLGDPQKCLMKTTEIRFPSVTSPNVIFSPSLSRISILRADSSCSGLSGAFGSLD